MLLYIYLCAFMCSRLAATISGTPHGLNVRKTLIPTDRINLQSTQHAGAPNDRKHHQEIMLLTWAAAPWKQNRCEQMQKQCGFAMPSKQTISIMECSCERKYGMILLYDWPQKQKNKHVLFICFYTLKTDFIFCHILVLSLFLSLSHNRWWEWFTPGSVAHTEQVPFTVVTLCTSLQCHGKTVQFEEWTFT